MDVEVWGFFYPDGISSDGSTTSTAWWMLPGSFQWIKMATRNRAEAEGKQFATIGVSLDLDPARGMQFLDCFDSFEEVIAARGWLNTGSANFMVRGLPGQLAAPQVLIIKRVITATRTGLWIDEDRVIDRHVGVDAIADASFVLLAAPATLEGR